MELSIVILAAGKSTRFKSAIPKILHPLGGKPLLDYTLELATHLSTRPPVIVVGPEVEASIQSWAKERAQITVQVERLGTGHAVMQAQPLLEGHTDQVLVLYGDMPLLRVESLQKLIEQHEKTNAAVTILTVQRQDPRGFGRIVRNGIDHIVAIVEDIEASPEIAEIRELNTGIYIFDAAFLWSHLPSLQPSPRKGEYYLTDLVASAAQEGYLIEAVPVEDPTEGMGINTRIDLALASQALQQRINEHWMLEGITLLDPATTHIDAEVTLGQDTVIYPNTHLRGATTIGTESIIGPNTVIESCTIGNRCRVTASVLEHAVMEDESNIGPFGHLRKGAHLCKGAHMGNFGEMKNSTLGPGAKMGHFSYLGDAQVGARTNIGAGAITCNYDGKSKYPTTIEEDVFIGSDTMLVAPLHIGAGAKTGAGSVVTHDVPPHSTVYGVPARTHDSPAPDTQESEEKGDRERR
jgi:bifunctional UDP-N-acetylglucosamine pyrophosphorylase/glucosamine-1-phosphate N-acetyltransferase